MSALARSAARLIRLHGAAVTLTRTTRAARDEDTQWIPGEPTAAVYEFRAKVTGVSAEYVDGSVVLASDLMVIAPPTATLDGAIVDLVPLMSDTLQIDGKTKVIKKIRPGSVEGGAVALYRIFVAS